MNNFIETEKLANEMAADFFKNHKYKKTANNYDVADFYITVKGKPWIGETKNRSVDTLKYDTFIMEYKKFKNMEERMQKEDCKNMIYVNFFGNTCMIWDYWNIVNFGIKEKKMCRKKTAVYSEYVEKDILMLPKDRANIYTKDQDGKWTLFSKPLIK